MSEGTFVCLDCGFAGEGPRLLLEAHWRATGHGPADVQRRALDRARLNLVPPARIDAAADVGVRLKAPPEPPGDLA